jgi:hypothetical protein
MINGTVRFTLVFAGLLGFSGGRAAGQVPIPDHIVIVIEENHSYNQIIGSASAPFINGLRIQGALLTNSYGITHPSQPNYLALFSGSTQGVTTDATPTNLPFTTPNLGAQLLSAGITFAGYSEGMPSVGYTGDSAGGSGGYRRKHNPWVNWQQISGAPPNTLPSSVNLPYALFPSDFTQLPRVSFVIPTQLHDMHDGTIAQGDTWLKDNLNNYIQWSKTHNSIFIMTFDEDNGSSGNRIATILVGQSILAGVASSQSVNHYNLLATLEDMTGLPRIGNAVGAQALTGIFAEAPYTISGHVTLADYSGSPAGVPFTLFIESGNSVVDTLPTTLDANGNYSVMTSHQGTYDAVGKGSHWLGVRHTDVPITGPQTIDFDLSLNGDADDDNAVNLDDLNQIFVHFAELSVPNVDLDGSGQVDLIDLTFVLINFGLVGD